MAFLLDDLLLAPVNLPAWLGRRLRQMAMEQVTDESKVQEELLENQMRLELGESTEAEYRNKEAQLMERLDEIRRLKKADSLEKRRRPSRWQTRRRPQQRLLRKRASN